MRKRGNQSAIQSQSMENQKVFASVLFILESPRWKAEVGSFVDEHCIVFDDEEESSLEHGKLHNEYTEIVEQVLSERLAESNIEPEAFVNSVQIYAHRDINRGKSNKDEEGGTSLDSHATAINQVLAVSDYLVFKKIMLKRNLELEMEAAKHPEFEGLYCSKLMLTSKQMSLGNTTKAEMRLTLSGSKKRPILRKASKNYTDNSNNARHQCELCDEKESVEDGSLKGNVPSFQMKARQNRDNESSIDKNSETDDVLSATIIRNSEGGGINIIGGSPSLARKKIMVDKHNIFINVRKARHQAEKGKILNEDQDHRQEYFKHQRDLIHSKNDG